MTVDILYRCTDCKQETTRTFECEQDVAVVTKMQNGKSVMTVGQHTSPTFMTCECGGIATVRSIDKTYPEAEQPEEEQEASDD